MQYLSRAVSPFLRRIVICPTNCLIASSCRVSLPLEPSLSTDDIGEWTALPLALRQPSIIANEAIRLESETPRQTSYQPHLDADATPRLVGATLATVRYATRKHEAMRYAKGLTACSHCLPIYPARRTRCLGSKRGDGAGDERASMSFTSCRRCSCATS